MQEARNLGYTYFQGYFFCKPSMLSGRDIPAVRSTCLRLLEERIHRRCHSARNSQRSPCLSLLGEREFRRWAAIVTLVMAGGDKPAELNRTVLPRAYFCEELARPLGLSRTSSDLFFMGLLSSADALLDRPMTQILTELSLSAEIRTALSRDGGAFGNVYETMFAYERADWDQLSRIARNAGHSEEAVPDCFVVASTRATWSRTN